MSNIPPTSDSPPTPRRKRSRLAGVLLLTMAGLLAYFLLIAYLGWQSGQQLLTQRQEQEFTTQIARQVELAQADIEAENYGLAMRRLEWVLARDSQHTSARTLHETAQAALQTTPSDPSLPQVTAVPTNTPLPTPTPGLIDNPADELARIEQLLEGEAWKTAVSALTLFRNQHPSYQRTTTDRLLYDAYIGAGLTHVQGERPELGLYYFRLAEQLGDLPQEANDYRLWAELYTQGISFYDVNWDAAAYYFRDLCAAAPFYQNACQQLIQILTRQGDLFAFNEDWCPAERLYHEAQGYGSSSELSQKLFAAREGCLLATPTPSAPITDTVPMTGTQSSPFVFPIQPSPSPTPES